MRNRQKQKQALAEMLIGKVAFTSSPGSTGREEFKVTSVIVNKGKIVAQGVYKPAEDNIYRVLLTEGEYFEQFFTPIATHNGISKKLKSMLRFNSSNEVDVFAMIDRVEY